MADYTSGCLRAFVSLVGGLGGAFIDDVYNNSAHRSDLDAKMIKLIAWLFVILSLSGQ